MVKSLLILRRGQIWTLSLIDTTSKPEKLFQSRGGQSQIRWSPDGTMIAFTSDRGDHSFIGIYHLNTKTVSFVETSMDNDTYPVWSPDNKQLAYIRIPNMNGVIPFVPVREGNPWSIRSFDIQSGKTKELWKASAGKGSIFLNDIPVGRKLTLVVCR